MRRFAVLAADAPDYPLATVGDARKLLEVAANSVLRRILDAKSANAIVNVVNAALRVQELGSIQERINTIEAEVEALGTKLTPGGAS